MIKHWHDIQLGEDVPKVVNVLIEISKGSSTKYEIDKVHGLVMLDRFLHSSVHFPGDYGFIPQTYGGDRDALDVIVYTNGTVLPQTIASVRPIGVMKMIDSNERDDKIIGIYTTEPMSNEIHELSDLPKHFIGELKEFFESYKKLEGKKVKVLKFLKKKYSYKIILDGIKDYKKKFGKNNQSSF